MLAELIMQSALCVGLVVLAGHGVSLFWPEP